MPVADQTIGVLLEKLIKEASRLTEEDSTTNALAALKIRSEKNSAAHSTKEGRRKTKYPRNTKAPVECYYCKKKGHFARDCYKQKRDKENERVSRKKEEQCLRDNGTK